jgi:large subunit ribosomal protein L30
VSYLKIKWVRSANSRTQDQRDTIRSLGFKKLQQERVVKNTPEIRGMVKKVIHLLEIVEEVR